MLLPNSHANSLPNVIARLLSVNVGLPRDVTWQGRTVHTGIWKAPVAGPRMVRRLNVEGDGQGDMNGHGGERRAVFVYQMGSYRHWQNQLGRNDFVYGHRQFPQHSAGLAGLSHSRRCQALDTARASEVARSKPGIRLRDYKSDRIAGEQLAWKLPPEFVEQPCSAVILVKRHRINLIHIGLPQRHLGNIAANFDGDWLSSDFAELSAD